MPLTDKPELFLIVLEANKGIIYKVGNLYCREPEDRKDLVQEIILQLWRSFDNYNAQYKHTTWIYRIALNVAISYYRKESRRSAIANPLSEELLSFSVTDMADNAGESISLLYRFIAELKELERALMLLYLDEKSHKEIAEIMGITETNVATKIGRIKKVLKQKFSQVKNQI